MDSEIDNKTGHDMAQESEEELLKIKRLQDDSESPIEKEKKDGECKKTFIVLGPEDQNALQKTNATAFTIDFGAGKQVDTVKYKSLMDKFEKRHKRGVSLSKLDEKLSVSADSNKSPTKERISRIRSSVMNKSLDNDLKLRNDKSRKTVWTPSSQMSQSISFHEAPCTQSQRKHNSDSKSLSPRTSWYKSTAEFEEKNLTSLPDINSKVADLQAPILVKDQLLSTTTIIDDSATQHNSDEDSNSSISETGTYTIENDTYTEEQKAKMSIDRRVSSEGVNSLYSEQIYDHGTKQDEGGKTFDSRSASVFIQYDEDSRKHHNLDFGKEQATNNELKSKVSPEKNVLEVSYCYEPPKEDKTKTRKTVLEKLKNRVRSISERKLNIPKSPEKNLDVGSFTSVTTSGVLSSKGCESHNKNQYIPHEIGVLLKRKNSLTKSQIDTSDYLQYEIEHSNPDNNQGIIQERLTLNPGYCNTETPEQLSKNDKTTKSFEKSWIYEWAKSASEHNRKQLGLPHSSDVSNELNNETKLNNNVVEHLVKNQRARREMSLPINGYDNRSNTVSPKLPPKHPTASPTKIPSPISTLTRPRSRNSISLSGSTSDLNSPSADTQSYLCNTEDVINILSKSLSNHMRPGMSTSVTYSYDRNVSPMHSLDSSLSPKHISYITISPASENKQSNQHNNVCQVFKSESSPTSPQHSKTRGFMRYRHGHTRHFSFDNSYSPIDISSNKVMNNSLTQKNDLYDKSYKVPYEHAHNLKPSYDYLDKNNKDTCLGHNLDHLPPKPMKCFINKNDNIKMTIDQTPYVGPMHTRVFVSKDNLLNQQRNSFRKEPFKETNAQAKLYNKKPIQNDIVSSKFNKHQNSPNSSPIRRSSSFSVQQCYANDVAKMETNQGLHQEMKQVNKAIHRSASNANVKKGMNIHRSGDISENYFEDSSYDDDEYSNNMKNKPDYDSESNLCENTPMDSKNKEAIKNTRCNRAFSLRRARLEAEKVDLKKNSGVAKGGNVTKTDIKGSSVDFQRRPLRSSMREHTSMPRDSSLQRIKQNIDISHDINIPQKKTGPPIQPRYMDISKYKSPTSSNFLRKDESKSYLETRSVADNSSKSKNLARNDNTRLSLRSVKATGNKGVMKKEIVKNPSKEQELANWRRRATYDPMKAAAEGKKKAELAKRVATSNIMTQSLNEDDDVVPTNSGGAVLRSQSYHGTAALDWLSTASPKNTFHGNRKLKNTSESQTDTSDEEITLS